MKRNIIKLLLIAVVVLASNSLITTVSAQSSEMTFDYTIRKGNTLYLLAERFNSSVDRISSQNPQIVPENLIIGSKLKITSGKGVIIHPIKKGETLWRIARKYNSNITAIAEKNYIENPSLIFAGDILAIPEPGQQNEVMALSKQVISLFKNRDFQSISMFVHPAKGIRFSPYAYVDTKKDLVFFPLAVSKFSSDSHKYTWGAYDGTGDPINLTPSQYFDRFVYRKDFAAASEISYNKIIGTGNSLENQFEVYPGSNIVEYYIPGIEYYNYMDWQSLRLAFEKYGNKWYLTGVIHNEWTI